MARLPTLKRIAREDIPEAPAWFDKLMLPLNQFLESVYFALDKQLTFGDNITSQQKTIDFRTLSTYGTAPLADNFTVISIALTLKQKVRGVLLLDIKLKDSTQTVITSPVTLDWIEGNGVVNIRYITGLTASTDYRFTILIF